MLGVTLAMLIRSSRVVERALYPWLVVSQMVPVPAVAPIFVIWTGFDLRPKIMVIALVAFFPIAVNTIDGLQGCRPAASAPDADPEGIALAAVPSTHSFRPRCRSCSAGSRSPPRSR